ncbi:MAG: serine/threonine-protein kinase [Acidimicrobiales bacterium]
MSVAPPAIAGLTVHEQIGRGGFSTVWRAVDDAMGRQVAVKVLSAQLTDDSTAMRFERECRALGAVAGHPNIVTVHQVGTTPEGFPFIVMAYERNGSFGDRLAVGGRVPWTEAVTVGLEMAEALEVAHGAGVLHRDVKPDNILVGDYGDPKLTDFGIARLVNGPHTTTGSVSASVVHAPPEVLHGRAPDASADVYSLCSTIYTLISGSPPFYRPDDESLLPLITRISTQPPPRLAPPVPDALNDVLTDGLAKDPGERIPTAAELAGRLRSVAPPATVGSATPGWAPPIDPRATAPGWAHRSIRAPPRPGGAHRPMCPGRRRRTARHCRWRRRRLVARGGGRSTDRPIPIDGRAPTRRWWLRSPPANLGGCARPWSGRGWCSPSP